MTDRAASPGALVLQRLRRNRPALAALRVLGALYLVALLAPFLAPHSEDSTDRRASFHPPSRVVWTPWPAVERTTLDPAARRFVGADGPPAPLRLLARGDFYTILPGVRGNIHLLGVAEPGARFYLLGADQLGRDVFSRLLYGARISLSVGLFGIAISFTLGLLLGGIAGYYGGWIDTLLMRGSEVLMSIPGLFLILALRAAFPATLSSAVTYFLVVVILSFVSWPALGRIVRGMVLSLRTRDYVAAAESLGYPPLRIIARHILPNTMSFVIVAATISIPGYILAEVALSFLGAGIQEPQASWGNMLQGAASVSQMEAYPWILWPGVCIFVTVFAFNVLGDGLRDAMDPRHIDE